MNNIYLDNAATTPILPGVADIISDVTHSNFFNPSAQYKPSIETLKNLKDAKSTIAKALNVSSNDLYFTSGATEANNTIIKGAVERSHGDFNIVTSAIEHPSVREVFKYLQGRGVNVKYVPVDEFGHLDYDWLKENIDENTSLVSLMGVNNEIGAITDLNRVRKIIDKYAPNALFHTDYVQAFLKSTDSRLDLKRAKPDAITVTAHKVNGPKGIGAMSIKRGARIAPLLHGGGQEGNFRPGTENVAGILGFEEAVKYHLPRISTNEAHVSELREYLIQNLNKISDVYINSPQDGISNLLSFSVLGVKAEVVLHVLGDKGIYVAAGSACSSKQRKNSYVHEALGYDGARSDGTFRVSMSEDNTKEDIDILLEELKTGVDEVRKVRNSRQLRIKQ